MADIDNTIGELKRERKLQKSLKKRERKETKHAVKAQKRGLKKERKAQKLAAKAGMEYTPTAEVAEEDSEEGTTIGIDWARQSNVSMERVERQLDNLFENRGEEIRKRWEEKYGSEPDIPDNYFRPKVDMDDLDRTPTSSAASAEGAQCIEPVETKKKKKGRFGRKKGEPEEEILAEGEECEVLGIWDLKLPLSGLWLYQSFGVKQHKLIGFIIMIVSLILWIVPMLPIRFVVLIIRTIIGAIKKRRGTSTKA